METIRRTSNPRSNRERWTLWSKKQETESTKAFNSALEKSNKKLVKAKETLRGISLKFSRYKEVQDEFNKIQLAY